MQLCDRGNDLVQDAREILGLNSRGFLSTLTLAPLHFCRRTASRRCRLQSSIALAPPDLPLFHRDTARRPRMPFSQLAFLHPAPTPASSSQCRRRLGSPPSRTPVASSLFTAWSVLTDGPVPPARRGSPAVIFSALAVALPVIPLTNSESSSAYRLAENPPLARRPRPPSPIR